MKLEKNIYKDYIQEIADKIFCDSSIIDTYGQSVINYEVFKRKLPPVIYKLIETYSYLPYRAEVWNEDKKQWVYIVGNIAWFDKSKIGTNEPAFCISYRDHNTDELVEYAENLIRTIHPTATTDYMHELNKNSVRFYKLNLEDHEPIDHSEEHIYESYCNAADSLEISIETFVDLENWLRLKLTNETTIQEFLDAAKEGTFFLKYSRSDDIYVSIVRKSAYLKYIMKYMSGEFWSPWLKKCFICLTDGCEFPTVKIAEVSTDPYIYLTDGNIIPSMLHPLDANHINKDDYVFTSKKEAEKTLKEVKSVKFIKKAKALEKENEIKQLEKQIAFKRAQIEKFNKSRSISEIEEIDKNDRKS